MFKKVTSLFLAVALVVSVSIPAAFSANESTTTSKRLTRTAWETVTTNDTVTVLDSGRRYFANISTGELVFTLPTANDGLSYTFTSINGNGESSQGKIILNPQSTDTFVGCVNGTATTTFAAGDDLDSPEATGDSVTIVATSSNQWVCTDRIGTWADGD